MGIKILLLSLLIFLVLFMGVNPAQAAVTRDDSDFTITQTPNPVFTNSNDITITIHSAKGSFLSGTTYSFSAWNLAVAETICLTNNSTGTGHFDSVNQYTVRWTIQSCRALIGRWKFQLWVGAGTNSRSNASLIVSDYQFEVQQAGGQVPTLEAKTNPNALNSHPIVGLNNARKDSVYTFWWDTSANELAADPFTANNDGSFNIPLNLSGVEFKAGLQRKLCMEIGNYRTPRGVTCRFSTNFDFIATPGNTQLTCSISPSRPTRTDSVSISGINFPPNQNFRADLITNGNPQNLPGTVNSGSTGAVSLQLGRSLQDGNYTGIIYNSNNDEVCRKDFQISAASGGTGTANCQTTNPPSCSKGTGISCDPDNTGYDPNNPPKGEGGVMTAIGCIPTDPTRLIPKILGFAAGIGGTIALLLMVFGAFQMITSAGNPESIKKGRDQFVSAVIGLMFIILSVTILRIIGFDILNLPGFG